MRTLDNMAHASNERRNQNIMKLRQAFNDEKYNTISQAARGTGYTYQTVKKWAIDGDIPLLDENGTSIVKITEDNQRKVNEKRRIEHINKLNEIFHKKEAITVSACASKLGYPEETIISWAKQGEIPLLMANNELVVPFNEYNRPYWLDSDDFL